MVLKLPIVMNAGSSFDVKDLSKVASIKLEGIYVNNKGKEIEVSKEIEVETAFDGNLNSFLTEEVTKYVSFNVNGNKGIILQTLIKSNLVDNKLPVKSTKLEMEIPIINNIEPKTITLSAKSQKATNGQGVKVFGEDDYKVENGKITLLLENNEDILSWEKQVSDEIVLTCVYDETADVNKTKINLKAKSEIEYYGAELKTVSAEINEEKELTEKIGDVVTLGVSTSKDTLYKGYMLEKLGKSTEFVDTLSLNIGYSEIMDKINFKDETKYVDKNENEYPANILYTYSKISKDNLVEILGEDGYINIYSNSGVLITTLNKENLEFKFEEEVYGVTFETSNPQNEGILNIENGREIRVLEYSKAQEEMFTGLKVNLNAQVLNSNKVIINGNKEEVIKLENPTSGAELVLNNSKLSTVVTNEDVELRVTLKTTDASNMLYKNPQVSIILPKYITNIKAENVKLLYEKELKLANAKIYKNENGNIVININLVGEQTKYNENSITEGATLIMNADITVDNITPTNKDNIELYVKNNKSNEEVSYKTNVSFIAPAGIATINQISGIGSNNKTVTSISGKVDTGELEINAPAKKANMKMVAINNYEYDCDNVVLLGRTTFEGNKKITGNEALGSTFTAPVVSEIKNENGLNSDQMTIYYSENKEANKNLEDKQNGWTENINEVSNVNSYMIVLDDYTFKTGDILAFNYEVEIPENLSGNEATYGAFAVYYEELKEDEEGSTVLDNLTREQVQESSKVGVATESVPDLGVNLSAKVNEVEVTSNSDIEEYELITYTANIENKGTSAVNNVNLQVALSTNLSFESDNGEYISRAEIGAGKTGEETNEELIKLQKDIVQIQVRKYCSWRNKTCII